MQCFIYTRVHQYFTCATLGTVTIHLSKLNFKVSDSHTLFL